MKEYSEFKKGMCEIYEKKFKPNEFKKTEQDPLTDERYNIVLLYDRDITEQITSFSKELNDIVPCTIYGNDSCHTTVGVFRGDEKNTQIPEDDKEILDRLVGICEEISKNITEIQIDLGKMLVNNNSVILSGYPDKKFWELQNKLYEKNDEYLRFRLAWGAHITAGRFNKDVSDRKVISRILDHVNGFKIIKEVSPIKMAITKFKVSPGSYQADICWTS